MSWSSLVCGIPFYYETTLSGYFSLNRGPTIKPSALSSAVRGLGHQGLVSRLNQMVILVLANASAVLLQPLSSFFLPAFSYPLPDPAQPSTALPQPGVALSLLNRERMSAQRVYSFPRL